MSTPPPPPDSAALWASKARRRRLSLLGKGLCYLLLAAGGLTFILPLAWMLSTSLKPKGSVFVYPPQWVPRRQATVRLSTGPDAGEHRLAWATDEQGRRLKVAELRATPEGVLVRVLEPAEGQRELLLLPARRLEPIRDVDVRWDNYSKAWNALRLREPWLAVHVPYAVRIPLGGRALQIGPVHFEGFRIRSAFTAFYLNSVIVAVLVTVGQVLTSSLAAYAFARLHFPGRDKLFLGYLGTLMVPYVVTMIPVFVLLRLMHLVDTYAALILPAMFSAYGTFMLRQFFLTIPTELEDAARIDGCGQWGIYTNVILPLSKPALATLTTFVFLSNWNSFMWPLIVISSPEKKTLPIGLYAFMGQYDTEWTLLMAASLVALLPVLLVFVLGQRYFVRGIVMSGLKG
ncbi:MAG: carbohydrate ABC transporter permease [Chloroflexi bacterium]|nr:carbohydrate ABC transporter permease [Chloroflexota bacterium]